MGNADEDCVDSDGTYAAAHVFFFVLYGDLAFGIAVEPIEYLLLPALSNFEA